MTPTENTLSKGMSKFVIARDFLAVLAKLSLGYNSKQLFFTMLSRVNAKDDEIFNWYNINIKDFESITQAKHKNPSESFDIALEQLGSKVYYHDPVAKRKLRTMLVDSDYYYGEGRAEVRFSDKMKPFLLQIQELNNYLKGSVDFCLEQKSSYAVLGYFLLMSKVVHKKSVTTNEFIPTKDEFIKLLNIPKSYQRTDNLKRQVIEPTVKAMNESLNSNISVEWEWVKRGVKVYAIKFSLSKKTIIEMTPNLFKEDGSSAVNIEGATAEVKTSHKKVGKLQKWFIDENEWTIEEYKILVEIAEKQMKEAENGSSIEEFMGEFSWWSTTKNDPISYRTFYILISALNSDYHLIQEWLIGLSRSQAGSFARQGAIVKRIKEAIKKSNKNVGREALAFRQSFLPMN